MKSAENVLFALHKQFVFGDQSRAATLQRWVNTTGGALDAIADDDSHLNRHIYTRLMYLFQQAPAPGGTCFVKDLQVGRHRGSPSSGSSTAGPAGRALVVVDVSKDWIEQLVIPAQSDTSERWKHPLPLLPGINAIYRQAGAVRSSSENNATSLAAIKRNL